MGGRSSWFSQSLQICLQFVDDMIRDHIIATLSDVLLVAESYEATTRTVAAIKDNSNEKTIEVNFVKKQSSVKKDIQNQKYKSCSGCFSSHNREECKFKNSVCNKCGKKGHIAPVCMSKNNTNNNREHKKGYRSKKLKIMLI